VTHGAWRSALATLVIAACARKPTVPAPASPPTYKGVTAIALAGDAVYALDQEQRLRVWDGKAPTARLVALQNVEALAVDASVALTRTEEGNGGHRVEIWELPSATRLYARSFEDGVDRVLAVSSGAAALRVNTGYRLNPREGVPSVPPPRWYAEFWIFASNKIHLFGETDPCHDLSAFSEDGRRFVCYDESSSEVMWMDLPSNRRVSPNLAPDWHVPEPARPDSEEEELERTRALRRGRMYVHPYIVLSLRLSPSGDDAFVAYDGTDAHEGWRLDRWTPSTAREPGPVVRLVSRGKTDYPRLLAVSRDGLLQVLGSGSEPLVIRRAPKYEPQQLAAANLATAAAVSRDGKRIVSGHVDGSLRSWDAQTGRLLATAGP
jgi:WD40 repeat protein